jgi:hypothetical protein
LGPELDRLPPLENDREFVLSLGGEEAIATIGADGKVTFENPEHLTQLTEADLLSLRLYLNGDAGNILWEYAFEHLNLYPVIDDDILPSEVDGAIEISADDTEIDLVAHIPGFANRSEDSKYDVNIIWENEGAGALARIRDMDGDYAIFKNTLTLPNTVGSTAKISASLYLEDNTQTASSDMLFRVVPGRANSVSAALSDASRQMYVGGEGQAIIEGVARDQFGNMVADGTSVTVTTDGSIKLEQSPEATVGGAFSFAISGTDYSEASQVTVRVGEFDQEVDLMINPVDVAFIGLPTEINTGTTVDFTVNVTAAGVPVKNYEFDVWAENARLTQSTITTDDNGNAVVSLIAPPNEVVVKVKAMTAMQSPTVAEVRVKFPNSGKPALNSQMTKMIGDATVESAFEYTRWDDASFSVNKAISGTLDVYGTANTQKTVTIGDIFAPNRLTQAAYWMNDLSEAKDEIGFSNGTLENIGLSKDTRRFAGSSFAFSQSESGNNSSMTIASATRLQLENDNSFTVDIKPTQAGGEIFTLGSGLKLELLASGELQLTAETDDGNTYTATQENTLALNQWHQIAGSFSNNILTLAVGDQRIETAVTGQLSYTTASLNVGQGYAGLMNSLKWFNLASDPLTTLADGSETQSVMLDSLGKATITINSAGKMLSFNSQLPMQSISVQADDTRQTIELLSTATFEKLAGASLSAGLVAGTPEFNLATLEPTSAASIAQNTPTSLLQSEALFPKAHAYNVEFMDVVGIAASLIGLDSLQVIWNQIGNMLSGKEVDIVAFSVALLDVLSLFPPAAPLKAVTIPAKTAIKLLKLGNSKAVQYLGGVMKKMFQQAKGRDFSLVYQGIAFFIIIADMALDEEAREGITEIAKMINSTDDFLDLMEYFSLADDEIALPDTSTASVGSMSAFEQIAAAEYGVFPQAHARVPTGIGKKIFKLIPEFSKAGKEGVKYLGAFAATVRKMDRKDAVRFIRYAFNKDMIAGIIKIGAVGGISEIRKILTRYNGQRIRPLVLVSVIGYLEKEIFSGELFKNSEDRDEAILELHKVILLSVPNFARNSDRENSTSALISQAHGKSFQLMEVAILHAMGKDVRGVEVKRDVYIYPKTLDLEELDLEKALVFGRDVDILVGTSDNKEIWYEVKSWKSKDGTEQMNYGVTPWAWRTGQRKQANQDEFEKQAGNVAHKQFMLDQVGMTLGATERNVDDLNRAAIIQVNDFNWLFHKFKNKLADRSIRQNPKDTNIRKAMDKEPTGVTKNVLGLHTGSNSARPVGKIEVGFLQQFLDNAQTDLKQAIEEEMQEFEYE